MRKFIIPFALSSLFLFLFTAAVSGENQNIPLYTNNGVVFPSDQYPDKNWVLEKDDLMQSISFDGYVWLLAQFDEIPEGNFMNVHFQKYGIEYLYFLPVNTYIVKVDLAASWQNWVSESSVVNITPIPEALVFHQDILNRSVPEWALANESDYKLVITFNRGPAFERKLAELESIYGRRNISEVDPINNSMQLTVKASEALDLHNLPFIASVEPVPPPAEPENRKAISTHRSAYISNSINQAIPYDGSGVTISIGDDGFIGPHIDFQGRIDQTNVNGTTGNHGDHCAGTITGAGNRDPRARGMAPGSNLISFHVWNAINRSPNFYYSDSVRITSTSYSNGCNAGYTSFAQTADLQIKNHPGMIHVFSAGNNGTSNCGYGAGSDWGNITGGVKVGKNVVTVGNLNYQDIIRNSSSRGPSSDGRVFPHITGLGTSVYSTIEDYSYDFKTGTSMSAPGISGVIAQLMHAYKSLNSGSEAGSALIKAFLLNGADDLGNPGPDFIYGYGRVNARKSLEMLENQQYFHDLILQNEQKNFQLNIPPNVEEVKVMIYWHDKEAQVQAPRALVNDLDMRIVSPNGDIYYPWVLNSTPDPASLNAPAVRGIDTLNNQEQVTINQPQAGNYLIEVNGTEVPFGPQEFYIVYSYTYNDLVVTYPSGGEKFIPNEEVVLSWDLHGVHQGNILVELSTDGGQNWSLINLVPADQRYLLWQVPNVSTANARIRVSRPGIVSYSESDFHIFRQPGNFTVDHDCPPEIDLSWNVVPNAVDYTIYKLGDKYMDSITTTGQTTFTYVPDDVTESYWFSVSANGPNGEKSRRVFAERNTPFNWSCNYVDLAVLNILNEAYSCYFTDQEHISVNVVNKGNMTVTNPQISLQKGTTVLNEAIQSVIEPGDTVLYTFQQPVDLSATGIHPISIWVSASNDLVSQNDTIHQVIEKIPFIDNYPYFADFESGRMGWVRGSEEDSDLWEHGNPSGMNISHAKSGQHAWVTGLTSNYPNNALAALVSPCFDFSQVQEINFSAWLFLQIENNYDGMILEFSTDSANTWTKISNADLYNNTSQLGPVSPPKWSGRFFEWENYSTELPGLVGENLVQFRFLFESDHTVNFEGVAIDDVLIYESRVKDAGITEVIYPVSGCGLSDETIVIVELKNFGQDTINAFDVNLKVNNQLVLSELYQGVLYPGQTELFEFSQTLDLSQAGEYEISVHSDKPGDFFQENDTISGVVISNFFEIDLISTPGDFTVCKNQDISLNIDFQSGDLVNWYEDANGSTLLGSGAVYTIQNIQQDKSIFVEQRRYVKAFGGSENSSFASGGFLSSTNQYQIFDTYYDVILDSVTVYANGADMIIITLSDNNGDMIDQQSVNVIEGENRVGLGFNVPVGSNYRLGMGAFNDVSLYRNNNGAEYPYDIGGLAKIIGSSFSADYYYYFYDWELSFYCESNLKEIEISVKEAPETVLLSSDTIICIGDDVVLSAQSDLESYEWVGEINSTGNTLEWNTDGYAEGTYEFVITAQTENGCNVSETISVFLDNCTGIETQEKTIVKIYPNPAFSHITVEFSNTSTVSYIELTDLTGRTVLKEIKPVNTYNSDGYSKYNLDLSNFASGMYILNVTLEDGESIHSKIDLIN
ncbi:MAG: T9SS C-terminal target domain-containing protein [Chitinophagaceae bacterium]|nr:MAG: T9SS C-terminal target domain-containing protein [Chitinophagaceae bacterium]